MRDRKKQEIPTHRGWFAETACIAKSVAGSGTDQLMTRSNVIMVLISHDVISMVKWKAVMKLVV